MKKKGLLGILAVLMVFALALTGCGQQGEQNAGATGSESQGDNGSTGEVVTTEPEEPTVDIGEKPDGSDPLELMHWYYRRDKAYIESVKKDSSGYYNYKVGDKTLACKTNVWDFIDAKEGLRGTYYVWRFEDMAESIGLTTADFETSRRAAAKVDPSQTRWDFALNCGESRKNLYDYTSIELTGMLICGKFDEKIYTLQPGAWAASLEQICFSAYAMEQLKLGRIEDEIMDSEFKDWFAHSGYTIPE